MVRSNEDNSNKAYYLDIWQQMLAGLLGWSDSQSIEWIEDHIDVHALDDPMDLYYHETPQYWIKSALVPQQLREALSARQRSELERRIMQVFSDEHFYHFPRGTDWSPYKRKIERILREYDTTSSNSGQLA